MAEEEKKITLTELYDQVNGAISAILLTGQSYKIGSRSLSRANITELRKLRSELEAQIAANNGSVLIDNTYVAFFDGR